MMPQNKAMSPPGIVRLSKEVGPTFWEQAVPLVAGSVTEG